MFNDIIADVLHYWSYLDPGCRRYPIFLDFSLILKQLQCFLCKCIMGNLCCFDCFFDIICNSAPRVVIYYSLDKRHRNTEVIYVKRFIFQNRDFCKMKKVYIAINHTFYITFFPSTEICCIYYCNIFPKHIS